MVANKLFAHFQFTLLKSLFSLLHTYISYLMEIIVLLITISLTSDKFFNGLQAFLTILDNSVCDYLMFKHLNFSGFYQNHLKRPFKNIRNYFGIHK